MEAIIGLAALCAPPRRKIAVETCLDRQSAAPWYVTISSREYLITTLVRT